MSSADSIKFAKPSITDANDIWKLINNCKPLDVNSKYLYLLLSHHFNDACVIAKSDSKVVGFISGYIPPNKPDVLFIWQVAVANDFRKIGLAKRMIKEILKRDSCNNIAFIEATVTPSNKASLALFSSIADNSEAQKTVRPLFTSELFGSENHESEDLVRIGPLSRNMIEVWSR